MIDVSIITVNYNNSKLTQDFGLVLIILKGSYTENSLKH